MAYREQLERLLRLFRKGYELTVDDMLQIVNGLRVALNITGPYVHHHQTGIHIRKQPITPAGEEVTQFEAVIRSSRPLETNRYKYSVRGSKVNPGTLKLVDDPDSIYTSEIDGDDYGQPALSRLEMLNSTSGGVYAQGVQQGWYSGQTITVEPLRDGLPVRVSVIPYFDSENQQRYLWVIDDTLLRFACNNGGLP